MFLSNQGAAVQERGEVLKRHSDKSLCSPECIEGDSTVIPEYPHCHACVPITTIPSRSFPFKRSMTSVRSHYLPGHGNITEGGGVITSETTACPDMRLTE
ncbi:hypothetical protein Bbelb_207100 [Branchiostoma belcheri]|nr:hypothetical protein Bbelb_207100 [Branchiostoma belcheri]